MTLELDHVFILVEPEAGVADRLLEQGFREGPSNTHPDRLSVQSGDGEKHLMEIALDHHDSGRTEDYRPAMPLILHW